MNLRPFVCSVLVAACALSGAAEPRSNQPRQIEEPPMSYKGEPYRLWMLAHHDTLVLVELIEETVLPVQHGIYEPHRIKARVIETIKGEPLPDEYLEYTRRREISRNAQGKQPGTYPLSGQLLLGIDRNALERNTETGLLHAGKLNFRTLPASVLRHLPMVKKDYPELFE